MPRRRRKHGIPNFVNAKKARLDNVISTKKAAKKQVRRINKLTGVPYTPRYFELLKKRKQLPLWGYKNKFMELLSKHQIIVLVGETGSGKTTQIPQWCVEYARSIGKKGVSCTQPRRIAATSVAQRVSEEMDVSLGQEVGYSIRFEDCSCSKTILKYMTDGMLLREGMSDPTMKAYQVILLDEAHERTLATDILMGVLKEVIKQRSDLKLVIMSATLDADKFQQYFDNGLPTTSTTRSTVAYIQGREHQVHVNYLKAPIEDYTHSVTKTICQLHQELPINEHMLAFLTGQEEIESMAHTLRLLISSNPLFSNLDVQTLYASLSTEVQMQALTLPADGFRRCILSTNVAETSLTIPGIRVVIDSGKVKTRFHVQGTGVNRLQVVPISQAQAWQRSGRAGRLDTGKCYRLYTTQEFEKMDPFPVPEIQRSNMAGVVLHLLKIGIKSPLSFDLIDGPDKDTLISAIRELKLLGAIVKTVEPLELTEDGRMMAIIPLDPPLAKVFISARKYDVMEPVLTILSILSSESLFQSLNGKKSALKKRFCTPEGDLIAYLKIFREYRKTATKISWCKLNGFSYRALKYAAKVRLHLKQLCAREEISLASSLSGPNVYENIRKCFFESLPLNVAFLDKGNRYIVKHPGKPAVITKIHPSSTLFNCRQPVVTFIEIIQISSESHLMCHVSLVYPEWIKKLGNNVNHQNVAKHKG